jgi:hypothetical protein
MFIVITPILGWSWPALAPIITAAAGLLGYTKLTGDSAKDWLRGKLNTKIENLRTVEIAIDALLADVVAEELGREERLNFEQEDFVLTFRKDVRGKFFIEVTGPRTATRMELRARGEEFARTLIQQFAHSKIARELDRRGVQIVEEEVTEEGDIILRTRRWG